MLTRFISSIVYTQRSLVPTTRLFNTSVVRLSDGDHNESKAKNNASDALKTGREKRWLDTVASDSEAVVKGEKQHANKQGDFKKDMTDLQKDTIDAIREKAQKGQLPQYDIGRRDTREDRIGSGSSSKKN